MKIISFVMVFILIFSPVVLAEENSIDVYITVTDITDVYQPFNNLYPRSKLTVSDFDISQFGSTLSNMNTIDGITYMHALVQLHREIYGDENISSNIAITTEGETKLFMGKSIESIMYKNGDSILELPQNIPLSDGDEINICIYNKGQNQGIATFNKSKFVVGRNENISMSLWQHYGFPRDRDPIKGAEIVDGNGEYITSEGNIITTNNRGEFSLRFGATGTIIVSAMPKYNYYLNFSDTVESWRYELQEVLVGYNYDLSRICPDGGIAVDSIEKMELLTELEKALEEQVDAWFYWDTKENTPLWKVPIYEEQLVAIPVYSTGASKISASYTTPLAVIEVTDDLLIKSAEISGNSVIVKLMNSGLYDGVLICAAHDFNNGEYILSDTKIIYDFVESTTFAFSEAHDRYKIMCLESFATLKPLTDSKIVNY